MSLNRLASAITIVKALMVHPIVATVSVAVGSAAVYQAVVTPAPVPVIQQQVVVAPDPSGAVAFDSAPQEVLSDLNSQPPVELPSAAAKKPDKLAGLPATAAKPAQAAAAAAPAKAPVTTKAFSRVGNILNKLLGRTPSAEQPLRTNSNSNGGGGGDFSGQMQAGNAQFNLSDDSSTTSSSSSGNASSSSQQSGTTSNVPSGGSSGSSTTTNLAPALDLIGDQTLAENVAIAAVNAADGADDLDVDGTAITYTCTYNVGTACTSLPGAVSFTAATGALTWTPDYTAAGAYAFIITGSDGSLSDTEDFTITVTDVNRAPVLDAIGDETVAENAAMTAVNAGDGADDNDIDGTALTYTCTYNAGTACTSLPGAKSFTAATGALTWTPDYTAAGAYAFTITGSDGSLSDTEDFTITVTNVNRAPVLDAIADETIGENSAMTAVNAADGANDLDADGDTITYTCSYNAGTACTSLPGTKSFTAATGALTWTYKRTPCSC